MAEVLEEVGRLARPGVTTRVLDRAAADLVRACGGVPAFKGYRGFPANICVSINEEVVHGVPDDKKLKEGDLVSLDMGVKMDGYYADAAVTMPVGEVSEDARGLLDVAREALELAIEKVRPGSELREVSRAIQQHAESHGYSVVRDYVGHGIGSFLHEEPQIPNFVDESPAARARGFKYSVPLREGMVLAIEPMLNYGGSRVKRLDDGWTVVTCDGLLSAHFEHTVAVTDKGSEILTRLQDKELYA